MRWGLVSLALVASCSSTPPEMMDPGPDPMPQPGTFLKITAPQSGADFVRSTVAKDISLVAEVTLTADASADIATIEWLAEDMVLVGEGRTVSYGFRAEGDRYVVAHGKDAMGKELATARVDFTVSPGAVTCKARLDAVGVKYTVGPMLKGVKDPITVTLPLNGMSYFAYDQTTPQKTLFMDCSLAVALYRLADVSRAKGVTAIEHIGIYNYRCIGGGNPDTDNCTPSQHAYAKAIDIHELRTADGAKYNVETDWIIDPDSEKTCSAPTSNTKDQYLHELVCGWHSDRVFNILLTPNYNSAHRNHFHVDLTEGSNFITSTDPASIGLDPTVGAHGD